MRPEGKPFRWNSANPNLIKRLKPGETQELEEHNVDRLIRCGASTLRCGDFDFVFVGRSLEYLFDLLSGALARTTWYDRTQMLQMSVRGIGTVDEIRRIIDERNARFRRLKRKQPDDRLQAFAKYLEHCSLMPAQILNRDRPIAFVDVVAKGTTYALLCDLMKYYCEQTNADWQSIASRLHWIAVLPFNEGLEEEPWKPIDSSWTSEFDRSQINTIELNTDLWFELVDGHFKTTVFYPPGHWGNAASAGPPPEAWGWHTYAARGSREMYRRGERSRTRLAHCLGESPEPIDEIKSLVRELRREARSW